MLETQVKIKVLLLCWQLCGHDAGDPGDVDLTGTSYNSSESTLKDLRDLSLSEPTMDEDITAASVTMAQQSQSLQQEFSLLNRDIPNISVDQVGHRHCKLTSGICICDVGDDSRGW